MSELTIINYPVVKAKEIMAKYRQINENYDTHINVCFFDSEEPVSVYQRFSIKSMEKTSKWFLSSPDERERFMAKRALEYCKFLKEECKLDYETVYLMDTTRY